MVLIEISSLPMTKLQNVNKFRNHIMIKNKKRRIEVFSFGPVTYDAVLKKVKKQSDILTKILKQN